MLSTSEEQVCILSRTLNDLALKVHKATLKLKIALISVYLQGSMNVTADAQYHRGLHRMAEWVLNPSALQPVYRFLKRPWLDLLATRENKQMRSVCKSFFRTEKCPQFTYSDGREQGSIPSKMSRIFMP